MFIFKKIIKSFTYLTIKYLFILEMEKLHKEEIESKDENIKNLQEKFSQLKIKLKEFSQNQNKRIAELQTTFVSSIKILKQETDKDFDLEDEINFNE